MGTKGHERIEDVGLHFSLGLLLGFSLQWSWRNDDESEEEEGRRMGGRRGE